MSEILPVIKVKHKIFNKEMLINEKDFNKEIHELLDKKAKAAAKAAEEEAKKKAEEEAAAKLKAEEEAKKKAEEEEAAKLKALMGGK